MSPEDASPFKTPPPLELCSDDACKPAWLSDNSSSASESTLRVLIASSPFILSFIAVALVASKKIFPALCGTDRRKTLELRPVSLTFGLTLGAAVVLAELILCEVSNWVEHDVRREGFRVTVNFLLLMLVVVIPLQQIHAVVGESRIAQWGRKWMVALVGGIWSIWAWVLWVPVGKWLPEGRVGSWSEECLGRVGLIGVSIMAILAGFGCVSSPWQTFFSKQKIVSDTEIARVQGGLDNAIDMIRSKQSRLDMLEAMTKEKAANEGYFTKVMATFRGDADARERSALQTELAGLEAMRASLTSDLAELQKAQAVQKASKSASGRLILTFYYFFSLYCFYRIIATSASHFPLTSRRGTFSQSDPINNILALLLKHYDPHLDRAAWSRQIGFAFSGVIIACTFSSAVTTFRLLARAAPTSLLSAFSISTSPGSITPTLTLFLCQICGVYALASAILLRSNLPPALSSAISDSLGAPIDPHFVDSYFDRLFLGTAFLSAAGMAIAKRLLKDKAEEEEDLEAGIALTGKRNVE